MTISVLRDREYGVWYPASGLHVMVGRYRGSKQLPGGGTTPVITNDANAVFVLDPRCLILTRDPPAVVYDPREFLDEMETWARDWLAENPEWPQKQISEFWKLIAGQARP